MTKKQKDAARARIDRTLEIFGENIRKEHSLIRSLILELRPTWSLERLEEVKQSYGKTANGFPGLHEILDQIRAMDALEETFNNK